MSLEKHLQELAGIKGYKASGIMNFTGEMLAANSRDDSIDFEVVGATFNDIFRSAHEAAGKVGLMAATETTITTPNGVIIMMCSGVNSRAHVHTITVLDKDGNAALTRMTMQKQLNGIVTELG